MWSDRNSDSDYLNFSEVADVATSLILDEKLSPLSLGIYGGWGAGKSTILSLIKNELETQTNHTAIIIEFDAWLYQDLDDARAALLETLFIQLISHIKQNEGLLTKAQSLLARLNFFRLAGTSAEIGIAAYTGMPWLGLRNTAQLFSENADATISTEVVSETSQEIKSLVGHAATLFDNDRTSGSPPTEVNAFRSEFQELVQEIDATIVIFVDNLDRCLPKNAIQTLEALRQFLFLPKTAFAIAADEDMIRHAVSEYYSHPTDRHINDYLDKMVQITLRVPKVGVQELLSFLMLLFAERHKDVDIKQLESLRSKLLTQLTNSWRGETIDSAFAIEALGLDQKSTLISEFKLAETLSEVLANSPKVKGNPRIVKRLMNTIRIRSTLAEKRGMNINEPVIAKLAIFERCTSEEAYGAFCVAINSAPSGKPKFLKEMEKNTEDEGKFQKSCLPEFEEHKGFIRQWCTMEPKLADKDLRAAIYLSKDTVALRVSKDGLSEEADTAIQVLRKAISLNSPTVKQVVTGLSVTDKSAILDILIEELRDVTVWDKAPKMFAPAIMLCATETDLQERFLSFASSRIPQGWPRWTKAYSKHHTWFTERGSN